jgi:methyltransferase-like protein
MNYQHLYDNFPYLCIVRPDIQPSHLATLATLFSQQPPPVTTARILELGCGNGINLIATAQSLPHSSCLGIDYSTNQITEGQKIVAELSLSNVTLLALDILNFDNTFGLFDYIIIHGVYSWVSEPVQEKLLNICQQQLTTSGIAYISYNTYPGWYLHQIPRELLLYYHAQQFTDPLVIRPLAVKQLLTWLVTLNQSNDDAFSHLLQEQLARFVKPDVDNYLRHDLLEPINQPLYFFQFLERIKRHHLDYITDVKFRDFLLPQIQPQLQQICQGNFFAQEQYLDFFFNRKLRMSLLGHQGQNVKRQLDAQILFHCYLAVTSAEPNLDNINNSFMATAINYLISIYPRNIHFEELFHHIFPNSVANTQLLPSKQQFANELLTLFCQQILTVMTHPTTSFHTTISEYPTVSPLARWQAAHQQTTIVNLLGQLGKLDEFTCQLLPHFNGKNNRDTLQKILITLVTSQPNSTELNLPLTEIDREIFLNTYLDNILQILAHNALLIDN